MDLFTNDAIMIVCNKPVTKGKKSCLSGPTFK